MPSQLVPPVPNPSFGKKVVHFVVGLSALAMLGSVGIVMLGLGAKKLGVLPDKGATTSRGDDASARGGATGPVLTAEQSHLLEQARADPDYRAWTEVDSLTKDVPYDLDELGALVSRLEPIESRWSSISYSKMLASRVEEGHRVQTRSGKDGYLKQAVDLVPKLRNGIRDRVLLTILMRGLPSLPVSRTSLTAFGKNEGMIETWDEGGMLESAEWRSWTIAPASKQQKNGRFPKGGHITVACDATGGVKYASLSVDTPGDYEYLSGLLALPKTERDLRHAARVKQILSDLPPVVHRFLLVAAPEQTNATLQKVGELAAQTPDQLVTGIQKETWMWLGTLAQCADRQVKFMSIAGGGLHVSVTQPTVDSRWTEIGELTKALGQ